MDFNYILDNVGEWKNRLVNNSVKSFEEMTAQRWLRIIAIVGAYLLIRPYLVGLAAKQQKKQLDKEADELGLNAGGVPNANALRGGAGKKTSEASGSGSTSTGKQRKGAK